MSRPAPPWRTVVRSSPGCATVCAYGELDLATAAAMTRALEQVASGRPGQVVVDLSGVTFVDATGLGALLSGARAVRHGGGSLALAAPPRMVRRMLALLDLEDELPVVDPT